MADFYQKIVRHVVFPLHTMMHGSTTLRHLKELERTQFLSSDEIKALQLQRLRNLLIHAGQNCPFYVDRFKQGGFDPRKVQSLDDIRSLPVLTKKEIQQNKENIRARNFADDSLVPNKTGGSTGSPLYFYQDKDRIYSREASTIRHNRWTEWDIGMKIAALWGHRGDMSGVQGLKSRLRNQMMDRYTVLDTSSLTAARLSEFKKLLPKINPVIYLAYANSIFLFARYLKETGSRDHHRPRAIITSAEVLEPAQRAVIEEVFGCPVFDRYGSRETSIIASECEKHTGLHICAETLLLEFVKDNQPVKPGELGKTLVTDLLSYGMPFIRYQIEDTGIPLAGDCSCGRGLPLMKMSGGRVTDFIVTSEGKIVSGAALTIYLIANAPGVAQAQLIQEKIDEVTFKIVKGEKFGDKTLKFFETEIPKFFGSKIKYTLEYVDSIPLENSGKYRFSISKVDPAQMF